MATIAKIVKAIAAAKERAGSSLPAIKSALNYGKCRSALFQSANLALWGATPSPYSGVRGSQRRARPRAAFRPAP